jgi:hypothetical protein
MTRDAVRVSTQDGNDCVLNFTNAKAGGVDFESIQNLAEIISANVDPNLIETTRTYLTTLLTKVLRESHGCLVGVVKTRKIPALLKDCTVLNPPLDLCASIEAVRRDPSAILSLHAVESLIVGIFKSDGIVIFNRQAQVLAYNGFIKLKSSKAVGGARRRAFEGMCDKLGRGLIAAFYQSQDGPSELKRGNE